MEREQPAGRGREVETPGLIDRYAALFVQRWDTYARQRDHSRQYYRVLDGNGRPVPLTRRDLIRHLTGEITLGLYAADERGRTKWSVIDSDTGIAPLAAVRQSLGRSNIPSFLEGSPRGGHLWVFWEEPLAPSVARQILRPYSGAHELFPAGDIPDEVGPGLLVRAPLGIHRAVMHRFGFLTDDLTPLVPGSLAAGQISHLAAHVQRARIPAGIQLELAAAHPAAQLQRRGRARLEGGNLGPIARWVREHDARAVIGRYVELDRAGMGHCPWGTKHRHMDRHRSFQVFESTQKWWCYTERIGGNAFDFLCRYHGANPAEMVKRIGEGEIFQRSGSGG